MTNTPDNERFKVDIEPKNPSLNLSWFNNPLNNVEENLPELEKLWSLKGPYREALLKDKEKLFKLSNSADAGQKGYGFLLLWSALSKAKGLLDSESTLSNILDDPDQWAKLLLSPAKYDMYLKSNPGRIVDRSSSERYNKYSMLFELLKDEEHRKLYGYMNIPKIHQALIESSLVPKLIDYDAHYQGKIE